jgi:hypothetical protein
MGHLCDRVRQCGRQIEMEVNQQDNTAGVDTRIAKLDAYYLEQTDVDADVG